MELREYWWNTKLSASNTNNFNEKFHTFPKAYNRTTNFCVYKFLSISSISPRFISIRWYWNFN